MLFFNKNYWLLLFFMVSTFTVIAQSPSGCEVDLSVATPELVRKQGTAIGTIDAANLGITINGNGWNALEIPQSINANSILEFEFASTQQGEEHAIGFTNAINSASAINGKRYKLYGTQNVSTAAANQDFTYTGNGSFQTFSIPVGALITGDFQYLVFVNDNDANPSQGHSSFRNIKITDADSSCLDGDSGGITPSSAPSINFAINFATANTVTPSGFIEDIGSPYGAQGGLTYGWRLVSNNAPTNVANQARNRAPVIDVDPIRETLIHMNRAGTTPAVKWEIDIPNGTYRVMVQAGDPDTETTVGTRHLITAEGQTIIDFSPGIGFGTRTAAAEVSVTDGAMTIDGSTGLNAKINSVVIQSADGLRFPAIIGAVPLDGATEVSLNTSISANFLSLPNTNGAGLTSLDNTSIDNNSVKLFKIAGAVVTPVAISVNGTGGGDAINISVATTLEANTRYRYQINGVTDLSGATVFPYTAEFITGTASTNPGAGDLGDVSFSNLGSVANGQYASLTMGPDGKLYGLQISGEIDRWNINANGTLSGQETLTGFIDAFGGNRLSIGLTFDPNSTANNLIAYVTHSSFVFNDGPIYDGKLSRISGNNLQNEQTLLTGLPRSIRDHLSNSIVFDPNNSNVLYFNQGSNSAGGAADAAWGNRPERLLTAATLRLNLNLLPNNLPLDVQTSDNLNVINAASSTSLTMSDGRYNPYANNAPLTIFASGLRNPYDLVWHSNGQLYVPTNGTAGGSNSPASVQGTRRPDGSFYNGPNIPAVNRNSAQKDFLFRIDPNSSIGYYGHPNPLRGEYVLNSGAASSSQYPNNVVADANYRGFAFDFELNKSPNGVIEYKFPGALQGALIVCRYSGGSDLITLIPDGPNGDIGTQLIGLTGFSGFNDPLDLVEDTNTGNIYVSDFATNEIILLKLDNPGAAPNNNGLTINPSQLTFEGLINENVPTQNITLSNLSAEALTINSLNITGGDAAKFTLSGTTAPVTIQPGNSMQVTVDYETGATLGNFNSTLVIALSNGTNQTVSLNGSTTNGGDSGITISFTAPENGDVYLQGEAFQVDISVTDNNGTISNVVLFLDGTFVRQENFAPYNWAAAGQPENFSTLAPGTHIFRAVATDNQGNTAEASISITILEAVLLPTIFVENMRKIPGTNIAFPYEDRIAFHRATTNRDNLFFSEFSSIRIHNEGQGTLTVSNIAITDTEFELVNTDDLNGFDVAPGAFKEIEIHFVADTGVKGIREADLVISSNDPTLSEVRLKLAAGYMASVEGGNELNVQQIFDTYGFATRWVGDNVDLRSTYPSPASVASGDQGDIVVSKFWEPANPNEQVTAFYANAFKGPGSATVQFRDANNQTLDGFSMGFNTNWHQTFMPRQANNIDSDLSSMSGSIDEEFIISIANRTTLGAGFDPATGDPENLAVRVYRVINLDGTVRPNEYYAILDFSGNTNCVFRGGGTCDYNDVGVYITNIKPVDETRIAPTNASLLQVDDCTSVSISASTNAITVSNLVATVADIQILDANNQQVARCAFNCGESESFDLPAGTYQVTVKKFSAAFAQLCEKIELVTIGETLTGEEKLGLIATSRTAAKTNLAIQQETKIAMSMKIAPNPVRDQFSVNFQAIEGATYHVSVIDLLSKVIYQEDFVGAAGSMQLDLNSSTWEGGLYFLVLESEAQTEVKQMVVVK